MNANSLPAPPRPRHESAVSLARISDRLAEEIDEAAAPRLAADGRAVRSDGWTPERIRIFLHALADCGVVSDAAAAAGMSKRSAYSLRIRREGSAFDRAWKAALLLARHRLADELMSRALNGCVEVIVRDGQVWGERHRFDNRTTLSVLARLDQQLSLPDSDSETTRLIAGDYETFVEIVCAGGDGAEDFLDARGRAEREAAPGGIPASIELSFVPARPE